MTDPALPPGPAAPPSQTLSRGLSALELIARSPVPVTVNEIAEGLGLHRSVAYRMVKTLELHGFAEALPDGRFRSGRILAVLAQGVESSLRQVTSPVLHRLAAETGCTAFLVVADGPECITLESVEGRSRGAALAQRPGTRHRLDSGAPGLAIMSGLSPDVWAQYEPDIPYRAAAEEARSSGYALSRDEVIPGLGACAAPILRPHGLPAALAIVYLASDEVPSSHFEAVKSAAETVTRNIIEGVPHGL